MLLALGSAGRLSDLRALDLNYVTVYDNMIVFEIGRLTKSRRKGQSPIKLTFRAFIDNPLLCVVPNILHYKEHTRGWRTGPRVAHWQ
jgi:hypothetical protein